MEADQPLGETQVADAEARLLHAVFDRLPAMIAYWDRDQCNVVANAAYIEWFGVSPDEMRGIHISKVLGESVYAMNRPYIERVLAGEEQLFDRTLVDTSGRTRHTQASYVPDIVDGEVRGFFVLVTDVTPRVEAQRAMDEAQSLAKLGSWSLVLATGEVTWSDELYRMFGVDKGAFVPTAGELTTWIHPDDLARVLATRDRAVAGAQEYSLEYRLRLPDGTVREVHSRGRPSVDASGTVVRFTGSLQDVTEANEAAREMARVNEELKQVNQLNADVLGMLGHDVRAPLTVVLGYLEDLDENWGTVGDVARRAHVAAARSAAERLRVLVEDILALASVESGTIEPQSAAHDLAVLVDEALSELPDRGDITVGGDQGVRVWCDAFHVRQIVANLAGNALRHGGPPVVVRLGSGDDTAEVTVSDCGPGVPDEFVPRLFERFARGAGRSGSPGAGLGLYIARRLAEANHGTLVYQPGPRGGATFTLTVPRLD